MFRGTGINAVHGPRNLVEFTYFPDSGFGATVAPTIITDKNQIYFSGNYPLEMLGGEQYEIELKFDPTQQTLYTTLIRNGESLPLKPLHFSASETDFVLNAFALSSYSDAGQSSQFSGSIRAEAQIDTIRLLWPTVPVPSLSVILQEADLLFSFTAEKGWLYSLQSSVDFIRWEQLKEISVRENGELKVLHPFEPGAARFFRLHLRKPIIGR
jgi:hypothetical protein